MAVGVDIFAAEIMRQMQEYDAEITEKVNTIISETAEEAVRTLKKTSPRRKGKGGGKYAGSWKIRKAVNNDGAVRVTIHNSRYQLTHLLEKGHAKRNGGRTSPIPHIAPVEEKIHEELIERLEKEL